MPLSFSGFQSRRWPSAKATGDENADTRTEDRAGQAGAGGPSEAGDNVGGGAGGDVGDAPPQPQDQILNITPDQPIRLVITSAEAAKTAAKKEHPQDRINKFWANFEPEYQGGITQILPDSVAETTQANTKKTQDNSPKALHSYEAARQSCIKSVKRIIRECRSQNQKYTDPHFDLERDLKVTGSRDCLYGLNSWDGSKTPEDVKRVTDIFEHPQFFKDGAGFDDIVQGALGDCWFLAGLSAVTANQDLLRKVCVIHDQDVGVYGFVFHRDGDWHPCIIDDKLYLSAPSFDESGETVLEQYGVKQRDQEKLYIDTLQKGSKALYFASCRDENETWVPLLEKAFAKAHGDYSALDGGQVGEALEDLTGGITTEIYTTNILSKEAFWKDLRRIGQDFIFSCHVSVFSDWRGTYDDMEASVRGKRLKGIHELHAYSVLAAYEGYGQRLVKIRNPWGESEWNGPWSDGSKEWTSEWLQRLDHRFGDDGVFWMTYDDMLKKYKYMDRTRLFGDEWHVAQEWTSVQVPFNTRDYQETKFSIDVPEDTEAIIGLSQLDSRYFIGLSGQYDFTLSFRIQKDDEDEDDYIARSATNYELRRSTNVEVTLEKGKYTVLFKAEAFKNCDDDVEKTIRDNISRKEKITQIATLYDLAYRKGRPPPKPEKKEEPKKEEPKEEPKKEEPKKEEESKKEEPKTAEAGTNTEPVEDKKAEEKKDGTDEKTEDKKDETKDEKPAEEKKEGSSNNDAKPDSTPADDKKDATASSNEKKEEPQSSSSSSSSNPIPTPPSTTASTSTPELSQSTPQDAPVPTPDASTAIVPDENDPNRNPWNAYCVVGLRVYSKLPELGLKVIWPGQGDEDDKNAGVTLDRDDIAKAPQVEAEKADQDKKDKAETEKAEGEAKEADKGDAEKK